jgi:hypothetical protein
MSSIPPDDRREHDRQDENDLPDENEQVKLAEAEAAHIGGGSGERVDPAWQAVREGGGGEAEGFEDAEDALIEHASHGDEQSAHAILHHQGQLEEDTDADDYGEADHERSSGTETD